MTINVKQEYCGGGLPTCTGKWLFDNANDLYTTAESNARLVPYQLGTNGSFTAYNSPADASVEVISEGITLRKATCFKIAIVVKDGYPSVYIDGTLVKTSTSTNNNRWFMDKSGAYLFCDNDGETADTDIAGIYFWNKALTAEQMAILGNIE